MSIPLGIVLFVLGLIVSLVSYVWATHARRIDKLERIVTAADMEKCQKCEPVTVGQITALFDSRFNEFRIELYQAGVLKAHTPRTRKISKNTGE
jgi:hypothetical protein